MKEKKKGWWGWGIISEEEIRGCAFMNKKTNWVIKQQKACLSYICSFFLPRLHSVYSLGSPAEIPRRPRLPLCHCYTAPVLHVTPEMLQLTLHTPQTNTQCHKASGTGLSQVTH